MLPRHQRYWPRGRAALEDCFCTEPHQRNKTLCSPIHSHAKVWKHVQHWANMSGPKTMGEQSRAPSSVQCHYIYINSGKLLPASALNEFLVIYCSFTQLLLIHLPSAEPFLREKQPKQTHHIHFSIWRSCICSVFLNKKKLWETFNEICGGEKHGAPLRKVMY